MADINSGIYSLPPVILSQDISQSYWQWSGQVGLPTTNPRPTSPDDLGQEPGPIFTTGTNELDKFRWIFLIVGVLIGAYVLGRK